MPAPDGILILVLEIPSLPIEVFAANKNMQQHRSEKLSRLKIGRATAPASSAGVTFRVVWPALQKITSKSMGSRKITRRPGGERGATVGAGNEQARNNRRDI
jgi:hypothetical protein